MATLAIIRCNSRAAGPLGDRVAVALRSQGLEQVQVKPLESATIYWFASPETNDSASYWVNFQVGFIGCIGNIGFRGRTGREALVALWNTFEGPISLKKEEIFGNHQIVLCREGKAYVFGDELGLIQLFECCDGFVLCTSWLACLQVTQSPRLDVLGAQDYILNGASHNHRTVVEQIRVSPANSVFDLSTGEVTQNSSQSWVGAHQFESFDAAADQVANTLLERTKAYLGHEKTGITSALSGGFDSRLILATLLANDIEPELFVYGRTTDPDVAVAKNVAEMLDLPLNHINKQQLDMDRDQPGLEMVHSNAAFFDGTPIDGLFDRGSDRLTRLRHAQTGKLQLNGGGGEIFRNFFYLRNRRYSAIEITWAFFHPFCNDVFLNQHQYDDYISSMSAGVCQAVGAESRMLNREQVEAVYPLVRVRFWTSRTNSIVARYGRYDTPLVDPVLTRLALSLPMSWKNSGVFEASLINRLSPTLGRLKLDSGFSPGEGPNAGYKLKMALQSARPPLLRRETPKIKRLLRINQAPATKPYSDAIKGELAIERILRTERLQTQEQLCRAYSLEALIRRHDINIQN